WSAVEQLDREFDAVGLYLSGHPLDQYEAALRQNNIVNWSDFVIEARKGAHRGRLAGSIVRRQERRARNGGKFAFIQFSDRTGQFEAIVFSDTLSEHGDALVPGATVMVELEAEPEQDGDSARARIRRVLGSLDAQSVDQPSGIRIVLDDDVNIASLAEKLTNGGSGEVRFVLRLPDIGQQVELRVPGIFDTSPAEMGALAVADGVEEVEPLYAGKVSA
ncbi:MAG: OB-fold nucleic acid binding domain-containing protein, partial [Hyphomicrobiales bacterium]|nr:OB-fold nucleic acid binding domain-containing protein [Hyphomicrobiales bacterium]